MVTMPALGGAGGAMGGGAFFAPTVDEPARPIRVSDEPKTGGMRWSSGPTVEELDVGERARLDRFDGRGRYVPMTEWTTYPR